MPTYPLTFPAVGIKSSNMRLITASSMSQSPYTFRQQVYLFPGARWEIDVTVRRLTYAQAGAVKAFKADLQGHFGTFLYGDPDFLAKGANGLLGGTPLVKGAGQTGNTLDIDGLTPSVVGWGKKGDYFQLGTGTGSRLYMLTEDVDSDGAGEATLTFQPPLRSSPADNAAVTVNGAKGLFRMATNIADWGSDQSSIHDFSMTMVEAIGE